MASEELTDELADDKRLAAAPLGVESHGDGRGEGRFTEHVGDRAAVHLISANRVVVVQVP